MGWHGMAWDGTTTAMETRWLGWTAVMDGEAKRKRYSVALAERHGCKTRCDPGRYYAVDGGQGWFPVFQLLTTSVCVCLFQCVPFQRVCAFPVSVSVGLVGLRILGSCTDTECAWTWGVGMAAGMRGHGVDEVGGRGGMPWDGTGMSGNAPQGEARRGEIQPGKANRTVRNETTRVPVEGSKGTRATECH